MLKRILIAAVLGGYASAGLAQGLTDRLFYGLYLTDLRYGDDGLDDSVHLTGVTAKLGLELFGPLSVEARLGSTGFGDVNSTSEMRFDYYGSAFLRFDIGREARLYGLAGGTYGRFDIDGYGRPDIDESISDISYGLGLELYGNESTAVAVEYIRHFQTSDYYIDGASLGFTHRF